MMSSSKISSFLWVILISDFLCQVCLAVPQINPTTDIWAERFYNFTYQTTEILKGKDDASFQIPSLPLSIPYCTNIADSVYVCTNGVLSFNRDHCPYLPGTFRTEITSSWPILAPFYADLTLATPESGRSPFLGFSVFTVGSSTATNVIARADADVNKLLAGTTTNYKSLLVVVVTWYYARAFGINEGVTFQSVIITNGMRSFVRYSYGEMQWRSFSKNVQIGFKFPSVRDNCKKSLDVTLSGHGDLQYPLDKIEGNLGEKGVWMYEISTARDPVTEVNDIEVTVGSFALSEKLVLGQQIVLVCKISLYSDVSYKWYLNNQLVQEMTKQTLIKDADSSSEGSYQCEITINGKSKMSGNSIYIEVNFLLTPSLTAFPSNNVFVGDTLLLSCNVESSKQPVYAWYKNELLMEGESTGFIYVNAVTTTNSGSFHCKCRTNFGSEVVSNKVQVTVSEKETPRASSTHTGQVEEGTTITMTCSGDESSEWYDTSRTILHTGKTFVIENIKPHKSGKYFCKVSGSDVESNIVELNVTYCGEVYVTSLPSNDVTVGSSFSIKCLIDANPPIVKYTWSKDSKVLGQTDENIYTTNMGSVDDQGVYKCSITCFGKSKESSIVLKAIYLNQPIISKNPQRGALTKRNSNAVLTCAVESYPASSIVWFRESVALPGESSSQYFINNATSTHEGSYTCSATNEIGTKTSSPPLVITLTYLETPKITTNNTSPVEGDTVILTCSTQASPSNTFQWMTKEEEQVVSTDSQLFLRELTKFSNATYECVVQNDAGVESAVYDISVQYLSDPHVEICPNTMVPLGENALLTCVVKGSNIAQIKWFKNGVLLPQYITDKINISNASKNDSGNYKCVVSSNRSLQSKTSLSSTLTISYINGIDVTATTSNVKTGETVQITCRVIGQPNTFIYEWRKDGKPLLNTKSDLTIESPAKSHSGFYECIATNHFGTVSSGVSITVFDLKPPVLVVKPSQTIKRNQSVFLYCSNNASNDIQYTWYKNGQQLDHKDEIFAVSNTDLLTAGEYSCAVADKLQSKPSNIVPIKVNYLTDPAISNSSHSVQNESSSAIFECLVTGTLPIQIHWEKEGEIVATGSFLKFQNISKNNESTYACVVGNQAGKKTVDFSLSVAYLSNIKLSVQPIGLINEGDTVILFCQHTTSEPVTYRWFHNDQLLPGNLEYWILSNVKIVDGGIYVCTADHRIIGKKSSPPIAIDINYLHRPEIKATNTSTETTLSCSIQGLPTPNITWFQGGTKVSNGSTLVISNAIFDKVIATTYCEVENSVGKLSSQKFSKMTYFPTPLLSVYPEGEIVRAQTCIMICQTIADSSIIFSWFHDNLPIPGNNSWYVLTNVSSENNGVYRCSASNVEDRKTSATVSIDVHYIEKPTIAIYPASTQLTPYIEGMTINLKCSANGNPVPTFLWFFNDKRLVESEELRLVDVSPSDSGRYTCHTNTNPSTIVTVSVDIKELDKPKVNYPKNQTIFEGSYLYLTCDVNNKFNVTYLWFHNDSLLSKENSNVLWMGDLYRTQSGTYHCVVSTAYRQQLSDKIQIVVHYIDDALMISSTSTFIVPLNSPLQLNCSSLSSMDVKYDWLKDGSLIKTDKSILTFGDVVMNDIGLYTCIVRSAFGTRKASHMLNVDYMSTPAVVISPSQKVSKGSTVFMNCNVSSSDVTLNYTWYFRDITLSNSGGVGKNFLVLENTRVEDEGVYSCSVSGARITKKSLPNTLNVHYLTTPKIDFEGDSQRLLEGSNYTFTCSVQSYPNNYSIQWYHNGKIIEKEIHNKLHLQAVTAMDSGRYECNARGELQDKNVSIVARVEALQNPSLRLLLPSEELSEGESLILLCATQMDQSNVTFRWYHDNKEIPEASKSNILNYHNTGLNDSGKYLCSVDNTFVKRVSQNIVISVIRQSKPTIMISPKTPLLGQPASLFCLFTTSVTTAATPTFQWYNIIDNNTKLLSTQQNFTSNNLMNGEYECRVKFLRTINTARKMITLQFMEDPYIQVMPTNSSIVMKNSTIVLICHANTSSSSTFRWYHQGNEIEGKTSNVLMIADVITKDEGTYVCGVKMTVEQKMSEPFTFVVSYLNKPAITLSEKEIRVGDDVALTCMTTGQPQPFYHWVNSNNDVISNQSALTFRNISMETDMDCRCIASNGVSSTEAVEKLQLQYLLQPAFSIFPETLTEGITLRLDCDGNSSVSITYKWYFNGELIHSGKERHHFLSNIYHRQHTGEYACAVSNRLGEIRSDNLDVQVQYLVAPVVATSRYNDSHVTLRCNATGYPPPSFKWTETTTTSSNGDSDVVKTLTSSSSLVVPQDALMDSFSCQVTNTAGELTTSSSTLNSHAYLTKPTLVVSPSEEVEEHDCIILTCHVEGTPPLAFTWYRDNVLLQQQQQQHNLLSVTNIKRTTNKSSDWSYRCRATNSAGWKESTEKGIVVRFMDKPQIKTILSSPQPITATTKVAHISSGNSISLSCLVDHANPTPSFVWFRDNKIIKTDTDNVLELHHATLKDTGEYTCLATNGFINKSTSISLHVHSVGIAILTSYPSESNISESSYVMIQCAIHNATDEARIAWYFNQNLLHGESGTNLVLKNISRSQSGVYSCHVNNSFGYIVSNLMTLHVNYIDHLGVISKPVNASFARYQCLVNANYPFSYLWSVNGVSLDDTTSSFILLERSTKERELVCTIQNDENNLVEKSASIKIPPQDKPVVITGASNETVEGDYVTFLCAMTDLSNDEKNVTWYKDGELVAKGPILRFKNIHRNKSGSYQCSFGRNQLVIFSEKFTIRVFYLEDPKIVTTNATIRRSQRLDLSCLAITNNQNFTTFVWSKDGVPLLDQSNSLLQLNGVAEKDEGLYTCAVKMMGLEKRAFFLLRTKYMTEPKLMFTPSNVTSEGDYVIITCSMQTSEDVDITWFKDDIQLADRSSRIVLNSVSLSNAGLYKCRVQSDFTTKSSSPGRIFVNYLHEITLRNITINETRIQITCGADGSPQPAIQWLKEGVLYNDTPVIILRKNETMDGYLCKVNNSVASKTRRLENTKHIYLDTPTLSMTTTTSQPSKQHTITIGDVLILKCQIRGTPPLTYTMFRGSTKVASSSINTVTNNLVHVLTNTSRLDEGAYTCQAENESGEKKTSKEVAIEVNWLDVPSISVLTSITSFENGLSQKTFLCSANGLNVLLFNWFVNGLFFTRDRELILRKTNTEIEKEGGEMTTVDCVVTNGVLTKKQSLKVQFEYLTTPILKLVTPLSLREGNIALLECSTSGIPSAQNFTFFRGQKMLGRNYLNQTTLTLLNVSRNDSAMYRCIASSDLFKKASNELLINVQYLDVPRIFTSLNSIKHLVYEGSYFNMSCLSSGSQPLEISWQKDSLKMVDTSHVITMEKVARTDSGIYTCSVENGIGSKTTSYNLLVYYVSPPSLSYSGHLDTFTGNTITISCLAHTNLPTDTNDITNRNNMLKYSWYKDDQEIPAQDSASISIFISSQKIAGNYSCAIEMVPVLKSKYSVEKLSLQVKIPEQKLKNNDVIIKTCNEYEETINGSCHCLQDFYGTNCTHKTVSVQALVSFTRICLPSECYDIIEMEREMNESHLFLRIKEHVQRQLSDGLKPNGIGENFLFAKVVSYSFSDGVTFSVILYFKRDIELNLKDLQDNFMRSINKLFDRNGVEKTSVALNATTLQDYSHCLDNNCHINAQCINTKYSFHCACLEGYHGTGVKCEQIAKSVVAEKGKSVDGQSESAFKNTTISLATLLAIVLILIFIWLFLTKWFKKRNGTGQNETNDSEKNNHRGSCASTLNLNQQTYPSPQTQQLPSVFDDDDEEYFEGTDGSLRPPSQHKSSQGHPYEVANNTSF